MRSYFALLLFLATACGAQASPAALLPTAAAVNIAAIAAGTPIVAPSAATQFATSVPTAAVAAVQTLPTMTDAAAQAPATAAVPILSEYTADNGDRVLGRAGAPITMLDYSDFQ
jgi:hypothetical protein